MDRRRFWDSGKTLRLIYLIVVALLAWLLLMPLDADAGKGPAPRNARCSAAVDAYLVSAVQYGEPPVFQGAYRQIMYSACGGGR
jgi:hypothetical protein